MKTKEEKMNKQLSNYVGMVKKFTDLYNSHGLIGLSTNGVHLENWKFEELAESCGEKVKTVEFSANKVEKQFIWESVVFFSLYYKKEEKEWKYLKIKKT